MLRSLQLIPTSEAATKIGCSIQHVRLLIRKGTLVGEKAGRDWFAECNSVNAFIANRYERSSAEPLVVSEPQNTLPFDLPFSEKPVNVSSVPQRSPFRYPGGKTWLIPIAREWLQSLARKPNTLVEPFAGGGGIGLMAAFEKRVNETLLVELDPDIASVWRVVLSDEAPALSQRILDFQCEENAVRRELAIPANTDLDRAFKTFLRNRVSRGGILAPGAGFTKKGESGKGISSRWYPATLSDRMVAIYQRRSEIHFIEGDGIAELNRKANDKETVFFIDPPYPVAGRRLYRFHDLDHRSLFEAMARLKGSFLATYDHNPDIEALALEFGFETRLTPMKSTHHLKKFELLISRDLSWFPSHRFSESQSPVSNEFCAQTLAS